MKTRDALLVLLLVLIALCAAPEATSAEEIAVLAPGYAICPQCVPYPGSVPWGVPITVVGFVDEFRGIFEGLDGDPSLEFTYAITGLVPAGWICWDDFWNDVGGCFDRFNNGTLRFYRDGSTPARLDSPGTFADGTVILQATCSDFGAGDGLYGRYPGWLRFTGGRLFGYVSADGVGFQACLLESRDEWTPPANLAALGYFMRFTAVVDVMFPVAAKPTTWGRLKSLYAR